MAKQKRARASINEDVLNQWLKSLGDNEEVVAASLLGVHPATIARWRMGDSAPRRRKLLQLAELMGVSEKALVKAA